jgi:hypothetical protein
MDATVAASKVASARPAQSRDLGRGARLNERPRRRLGSSDAAEPPSVARRMEVDDCDLAAVETERRPAPGLGIGADAGEGPTGSREGDDAVPGGGVGRALQPAATSSCRRPGRTARRRPGLRPGRSARRSPTRPAWRHDPRAPRHRSMTESGFLIPAGASRGMELLRPQDAAGRRCRRPQSAYLDPSGLTAIGCPPPPGRGRYPRCPPPAPRPSAPRGRARPRRADCAR